MNYRSATTYRNALAYVPGQLVYATAAVATLTSVLVLIRKHTKQAQDDAENPPPRTKVLNPSPLMATDFFGVSTDTASCLIRGGGSLCLDPLYHMDNPGLCSGTPPKVLRVVVDPQRADIDVGANFQYRAWAVFSDGRERDITAETDATWSAGPSGVLSPRASGAVYGSSVGTGSVSVNWRGRDAYASANVVAGCRDLPLDVVFVVERAYASSFGDPTSWLLGTLRLQNREGMTALDAVDRWALVTFADTASVDQDWTNVWQDREYGRAADRYASDWPSVSIGQGLSAASVLLSSARAEARKIVVLVTGGLETVCDPNPAGLASALKASGVIVAVVGLDHPPYRAPVRVIYDRASGRSAMFKPITHRSVLSGQARLCGSGGTVSSSVFLNQLGTAGFVVSPSSVGNGAAFMAGLPRSSCLAAYYAAYGV